MSRVKGANEGWQERVDALWAAFDEYEPVTFLARMEALVAELPSGSGPGCFELASAHDSLGNEAEAEAYYRRALDAGLDEPRRRRAVIQLASTLRNLGRAAESVELLCAERDAGSDELDDAVAAFLALALADAGRAREATGVALAALAPHLPRYNRSLANYAAELARRGPTQG